MGGAFDETGRMFICAGDDVLHQLNDVFSNSNSVKYRFARANNLFGLIPNEEGNWEALIIAYLFAGVDVSSNWARYLKRLGTAVPQGPQNIYDIAVARNNALNGGQGMSTVVHEPTNGGHVRTGPGAGVDLIIIDSPCPM
jgi:hypothetical protein